MGIYQKENEIFKRISVDRIYPNPHQPRRVFSREGLYELSESLKKYGMINPVTVRQTAAGYELVAGERRLRAAKMAGFSSIPCCVISADPEESSLMAMVENLHRRDLNFFEQAEGLKSLMTIYGMTQAEAAEKTGLSQPAVANKLRLLKLGQRARVLSLSGAINERQARALLKLSDEKQAEAADAIVNKKMNSAQAEALVEKMVKEPVKKPKRKVAIADIRLFLNSVDRAVAIIREAGYPAELNKTEGDGKITLTITLALKC